MSQQDAHLPNERIHVYLPRDLVQRLRDRARDEARTLSGQVRVFVEEGLEDD